MKRKSMVFIILGHVLLLATLALTVYFFHIVPSRRSIPFTCHARMIVHLGERTLSTRINFHLHGDKGEAVVRGYLAEAAPRGVRINRIIRFSISPLSEQRHLRSLAVVPRADDELSPEHGNALLPEFFTAQQREVELRPVGGGSSGYLVYAGGFPQFLCN
ncbi:hypothetical protein QNH14_06320 [Apirhabdus apintestini]|uniref:hypothetical protein n=1 Tax=Erwinia sp. HR93 TaxID=3094840 RepID=UPI002ADEB29A|nr:hypothetical protein [Erwinia sp. HR93]MEA1065456.1 hypothetical protein [Erwinia sp. HR93]WPM85567.1 hypothetical protein QNH14_06320 [Enterobacteriaceae bacterium CA-0114]